MTRGVSIIVPTYNEAANVVEIVDRCLHAVEEFDVEVLVVDDDSPDRTWEIAREHYADDARVRVVRRVEDKGLAQAVTEGFREARHEFCAVIDADLQHPPEKLPELLTELRAGADIAVGSRHVDGGGIENWSTARRIVSAGASALTRLGLPTARGRTDPMSGFFALRREVVRDVTLDPKGYKILLEILVKGNYESVAEVPYVFTERERGESKLTAGEYLKFVEHFLALVFCSYGLTRLVEADRAVRATEFAAIGGLGAIVNTAVFGALHVAAGLHYILAGAIAFVVALHWNFAGNWALTFDQPKQRVWSQYLRFNAVSIVGFGIYSAFLAFAMTFLPVPAIASNGLAILGASAFNFLGSETFAFGMHAARP